jgi:hypothetical protein
MTGEPQEWLMLTLRVGCRILRFGCILAVTSLTAVPVATASDSPLTKLAAAKFPNLTRCERAVLENADIKTTKHGPPAACGPSSKLEDPSNDPKNAATWDHQRDLRAELIRWVFVDPDANKQVDPTGIEALGARIVGSLDLGYAHAPFVLGCVHCAIPEPMTLQGAELNILMLSGSYTYSIDGYGSHIHKGVFLDDGFRLPVRRSSATRVSMATLIAQEAASRIVPSKMHHLGRTKSRRCFLEPREFKDRFG